MANLSHAFPLGEELPKQSVRVFLRSSLPGAVRMGEVDFGSQGISYFLVSGKFFAVIESNGFARFAFQKLRDNFQKGICMLSGEFPRQSDKASGSMFSPALCLLPNLPDGTGLRPLEVFYRWKYILKSLPLVSVPLRVKGLSLRRRWGQNLSREIMSLRIARYMVGTEIGSSCRWTICSGDQ